MTVVAARLFRIVALVLSLLVAATATSFPDAALAQTETPFNPAAWEQDASRAEKALSDGKASNAALDQVRTQIVDWRDRFVAAQSQNADRIRTLQDQIATLGPAPEEGKTEAPQIATRRAELTAQLAELQAPVIAAAEARNRADGIIREIDSLVRQRQANALLKLSPTPLNPLHWPAGLAVLTQGAHTIWTETTDAWANPSRRTELRNNLPAILFYLALATLFVWKGPGFVERIAAGIRNSRALRGRRVAAAFLSFGQVLVPLAGIFLLVSAVISTGMTGLRTTALVAALPEAAAVFFFSRWLGKWLFGNPRDEGNAPDPANALTDRPGEALFLTNTIGFIAAIEVLRLAFTTEVRPPLSQAAQAVWLAPNVVLVSIFVFRLGVLLRRNLTRTDTAGDAVLFRNRLIGLVGTAAAGIALLSPLLAVVGYVAAANALIWPTIISLGLIGMLILLQKLASDIYLAFTREDDANRDALIPVLAGFLLAVAALPVFALIWGARRSDLYELWTRFREGIAFGDTRISPTAFILFVAVFAAGYLATRLIQGALRSSVLPRTRLDRGAQNAVASVLGYVGIFLSALIAINSAGLDLSGLAIVAGALSVGIGFGLQNIVSNFVSGIILLIERPVSEGDMIEVGGKAGIVKAISVRSTRVETFDRSDLIVPNADLISAVVTNWTKSNSIARLIVPVGVAYGSDTRKVEAILRDIAEEQPAVLIDPPPAVVFAGFGADSLNFEIRMMMSDLNMRGDLQTELNHRIVERFAEEGIVMPFAQRDIWLRNPEALTAAPKPAERRRAKTPGKPQEDPALRPANPAAIRNDPNEGEDLERL